ncbi:MAG: epoxyqueuosine reductase QueH [Clostridia bacterium]|nr:epoxyqueuosine reductase QueH [Clostridia bacterium]
MTNYAKLLDEALANIAASNTRPRLLLHACCAPCSSYTLEYLTKYFDITLFFYNPNIAPKEEYDFRAAELSRFLSAHPACGGVRLLVAAYDSAPFFAMAKGLEDVPEGGERCMKCYRLRLAETAKAAKEGGFDYFCTTLSISPYKNAPALNTIGGELAEECGVKYLYSDFKKKGGYARSIELSKEYDLYRQDYCGCIYSKMEAEKRRK